MATKNKNGTPPLSDFINLRDRSKGSGFRSLDTGLTVAVYESRHGYQTLLVRIGDTLANQLNLVEGARYSCFIHPDQTFIALKPGERGAGSALFRPDGSRSLVYQTSLKTGTLPVQSAQPGQMTRRNGSFIVKLTSS